MNPARPEFEFDVAVVGGGSAGYAAARAASALDLRTVVIDGAGELGGLCILRGCMPSKALLHAAEVLHTARKSAVWGLKPEGVSFDFAQVMARKEAMVREFARYRTEQLLHGKFELVRATAHFESPHQLRCSNGRTISARSFVIATGSSVAPAPLPGMGEVNYLTSDQALELTKLPASMIVLGGGAVGVEFAQFFSRFGVKVSLVQRSAYILKHFDAEAGKELEKVLVREGVDVYSGASVLQCASAGGQVRIAMRGQGRELTIAADTLFHALGRVANIHGLGLDAAGVMTRSGRIVTDPHARTNIEHIYAAGDCAGHDDIVHVAVLQGEMAAWNIAHPEEPRRLDPRLPIQVVFSDPQVASVGLTEHAAAERGIKVLTASYRFEDHGKSMIQDHLDGFVKLVADPSTGELLGGLVVGPQGGELIHEIVVAIRGHLTVHDLAATPHYHPTLAEIWTYPAEELANRIPKAAPVSSRTRTP